MDSWSPKLADLISASGFDLFSWLLLFFLGINWSSLLFSVSLLTLGYLCLNGGLACLLASLKSLREGSELPLGSLQLLQTVPDSVCPNACVGVLSPWPPGVLGEALL